MKTGTIVGIGVGAVGLAAIGYYLYKNHQIKKQQQLLPPPTTASTNVVDTGTKLVDAGKNIIDTIKQYLPQPSVEQIDYEGKLIRVARDRVYLVGSGLLHYVNKLPIADGRGWESVIEVRSTNLKEGTPYTPGATAIYVNPLEPWAGTRLAGAEMFAMF